MQQRGPVSHRNRQQRASDKVTTYGGGSGKPAVWPEISCSHGPDHHPPANTLRITSRPSRRQEYDASSPAFHPTLSLTHPNSQGSSACKLPTNWRNRQRTQHEHTQQPKTVTRFGHKHSKAGTSAKEHNTGNRLGSHGAISQHTATNSQAATCMQAPQKVQAAPHLHTSSLTDQTCIVHWPVPQQIKQR
jgi:hypothetical protein